MAKKQYFKILKPAFISMDLAINCGSLALSLYAIKLGHLLQEFTEKTLEGEVIPVGTEFFLVTYEFIWLIPVVVILSGFYCLDNKKPNLAVSHLAVSIAVFMAIFIALATAYVLPMVHFMDK